MYGSWHVWPWLAAFSDVVLSCSTLSRSTIFYGSSSNKTGRLAHTIIEGNSLINIMGQENYELA